MTFSWNACPFSSVPAQVKMSYAIQMEHYTYEMFYTFCLFMCESLLWKLQWKEEYRSVYKIHVRATEK